MRLLRPSRSVRIAIVGVLVVSAISMAAASGRNPAIENAAGSIRMLTDSEMVQLGRRFPKLGLQTHGVSQLHCARLEHLFPRTSFYKTLDYGIEPNRPYLISITDDNLYRMPGRFNQLLACYEMRVTDYNVTELAKDFVLVAVANEPINYGLGRPGGLDSLKRVVFLEETRTKLKSDLPTEDAAVLKVKIGEQTEEWHFSVLRGQFEGASSVNEKGLIKDYPSVIVESLPGRGQLDQTPNAVVDSGAGAKSDTAKHAPVPAGALQRSPTAAGAESSKAEEKKVSLRLISVSEMMDFLHKFPEMLSGYSASERNDTGYLGQAFRFTEVTAAPLEHAVPAVRFYRGQSFETSESPSPYMMAVAGDKRYAMPLQLNLLLADNGLEVTDKNIVDLAEVFVISAVGGWYHTFPEITFLGATSTSPAIKPTNSKVTMIMGDRAEKLKVKIGEQIEDWYFYIQWSQFSAVDSRDAQGLCTGSYLPAVVESLPRRGQLNPAPNASKQQK